MTAEPRSPEEIKKMDRKQIRHQFPSGWMALTRDETLVLVIDALLEAPATREFTLEALAKQAGTVPERLHNHIDSLIELSVVESVEGSDEVQYTLNASSSIVDRLYELNAVVQHVQDVDGGVMPENDDSESGCGVRDDTVEGGRTDTSRTRFRSLISTEYAIIRTQKRPTRPTLPKEV